MNYITTTKNIWQYRLPKWQPYCSLFNVYPCGTTADVCYRICCSRLCYLPRAVIRREDSLLGIWTPIINLTRSLYRLKCIMGVHKSAFSCELRPIIQPRLICLMQLSSNELGCKWLYSSWAWQDNKTKEKTAISKKHSGIVRSWRIDAYYKKENHYLYLYHQHINYMCNTYIKHRTYIGSASNMLAGVKLQPYITSRLVTVNVLCGILIRCYKSPTNMWCQPEYLSNDITRHVLRSYTNIFVITFWRYVVLLQG